mgnify:CR=1 FL=1
MTDSSGLSVQFPLTIDANSGFYGLNQTYSEMVAQNLKNLVLTNPGERMMDPRFGVGLRAYLFEPNIGVTYRNIRERIMMQVERYMPFVRVNNVVFNSKDHPDVDHAYVSVNINYTILPLQTSRVVTINVDNN